MAKKKTPTKKKKTSKSVVKCNTTPTQEKSNGGNPTLYRKEYCKQLVEYFHRPRTKTVEKPVKVKGQWEIQEVEEPVGPPTLYGFAGVVGVCRDTLNEWTRVHPEFAKAVNKAKSLQADFIIENAMTNKAPGAFSIFMMKNNFKWKDRHDIEVSNIQPSIIRKRDGSTEELTFEDSASVDAVAREIIEDED